MMYIYLGDKEITLFDFYDNFLNSVYFINSEYILRITEMVEDIINDTTDIEDCYIGIVKHGFYSIGIPDRLFNKHIRSFAIDHELIEIELW